MDEFVDLNGAIEETEEPEEIILATITAVGTDGVRIQIDGTEEAGEKEYRVNSMQKFAAGDRVKIKKNSGTYLVEYKIGSPMEDYPIPSGGSDGQILVKDGSSDYAVKWVTKDSTHSIPSGGSAGQVLTKNSATDYDVKWSSASHDLPTGGTNGQVLTKDGTVNYSVKWADAPHGLPTGGSAGQCLVKKTATNYDVQWGSPSVSVSELKNGSYTFSLSSSGNMVAGSTTYGVTLGSSTVPIQGCYIKGNIRLGTDAYQSAIGFFGATPTSRKSVSNTADVATLITALKGYGLIY